VASLKVLNQLPAGTYRKRAPYAAYTVLATNNKQDDFHIYWNNQTEDLREAFIPKAIIDTPEIART